MADDPIETLVVRLQGTTLSMDVECEELGLDPMSVEVTTHVDNNIFLCTVCGWWCPIEEEESEEYGLYEWTCRDCCETG